MTKSILLVGTHEGIGLTSVVMGMYHALDRKGIKVGFFKPVMQYNGTTGIDSSHTLMHRFQRGGNGARLSVAPEEVQKALDAQHIDELMELIIQRFDAAKGDADVVIMEGLLETASVPYASQINQEIARSLSADVILACTAKTDSATRMRNQLDYAAQGFGGYERAALLGAIVNHVGAANGLDLAAVESSGVFDARFKLLGAVPDNPSIAAARVCDLRDHLDATVLFAGDMQTRRVRDFVVFARSVPHATKFLVPDNCIFCPSDRDDALMAVTLSAIAGTRLSCLVLTGPTRPSKTVFELCEPLLRDAELPILHIDSSSWGIAGRMNSFNQFIAADDSERMRLTQEYFAEHIESEWIGQYLHNVREISLSPASFRYQIVKRAIAVEKCIVLPEGDEPRTVAAAAQVTARKMARCVLLADPDKVAQVARQQGVTLGEGISVVEPRSVRENYIAQLVALRHHKGMNETLARSQLEDNVMLGTMMLEAGEVDGLVSGALHSTANTIRPALQIIKTAPGASMVSSVFFMCLPDKVMVYGDCAIVPKPDVEQLAKIAIQSNDTAKAFGIDPKVAMLSYSTGTSGAGEEVEKVKAATDRVRQLRPDILVDGPLQYDAAVEASVGEKKAPGSVVAGKATVFVFPDLNTGNTTYKAVQRSANAISMGPVLQGMRKPVNDLSRGALIDDIIYTIAITAVQAEQSGKSYG